jgi:hypothetical protein
MSPDDGQVMPETCRDFEPQKVVVKVKCVSSWLSLLRNYVFELPFFSLGWGT